MAYNNFGFPAGYQPMQMYQQPQPQQTPTGLIWVQGEGAAKSYLVAPGHTVALFDNESQTIYVKSADASGMPSIRILDYTFRDTAPARSITTDYATKEEVSHIRSDLDALIAKLEEGVQK